MLSDRQIELLCQKIQMARRCGRQGDVWDLVRRLGEEGVRVDMDPTGWLHWERETDYSHPPLEAA